MEDGMTINRKCLDQLHDCLELIKAGRIHPARYLLQVTIAAIEQKSKSKTEEAAA